jgi:hypothetical protein
MDHQPQTDVVILENLAEIEEHVRCRLAGRVRDFQLVACNEGVALWGYARTYYVKQLAQHTVMEATGLPSRANEIEVR